MREEQQKAWGILAPLATEENIKEWLSWPAGRFTEFRKAKMKQTRGKEPQIFTIACSEKYVTTHTKKGTVEIAATSVDKALELAIETMKTAPLSIKWKDEIEVNADKTPRYEARRIY